MGLRKEFAGAAPRTTLSGALSDAATSFSVASGTGYPTGTNPFVVVIDRGLSTEEKLLCSARSGANFTVQTRGYDGTTAQAHADGSYVEHALDAVTVDEANKHATDNDTTAHAAAKISYAGGTGMSATNVEAALDELATEKISAPASPAAGDVLTWDGEAAAWGAPAALSSDGESIATAQATASASFTDLATVGPAAVVTIGPSGKALVIVTATPLGNGDVSFAASGANTIAAGSAGSVTGTTIPITRQWFVDGLAAGATTFTVKYRSPGGGSVSFAERGLAVIAL